MVLLQRLLPSSTKETSLTLQGRTITVNLEATQARPSLHEPPCPMGLLASG